MILGKPSPAVKTRAPVSAQVPCPIPADPAGPLQAPGPGYTCPPVSQSRAELNKSGDAIQDMFAVIKNMETQLEKVMGINDLLEKDLKEANELNAELKTVKSRLEGKISRMEEEIPSKRELQIENDHLIDERNSAQLIIRDLKLKLEKTQKKVVQHQHQLGGLAEERKDAIQEVQFLESRLNNATQRIRELESQCNELKGEKIAQFEKIQNLDESLAEALDEKYRLHRDLKETKKALSEFHATLADTKLQTKKSYYKGTDEKS